MKQIILSSGDLQKAVGKLSLAVNSKTILPALKNIYCRVTKDTMEMITSDQEITIAYRVTAQTTGQPFEMLIPFDFIRDLSPELDGQISIQLISARQAKMITETDVFELNSLDKINEFPEVPSVPKKNSLQLGDDFVPNLKKVMHACGKENAEKIPHALSMAVLDMSGDDVNLVATDTQMLIRKTLEIKSGVTDQILFNTKITGAINKMGAMEMSWSMKQVAFKNETITVWAQRMEEKYPNYKAIIPRFQRNLLADTDKIKSALRKACLSSNPTKRTLFDLLNTPGVVTLEADDVNTGRKITSQLASTYSGETGSIAMHAGKLLSVLEQMEVKQVWLHIDSPTKAVMITSEEDPEFLGMIIPFK